MICNMKRRILNKKWRVRCIKMSLQDYFGKKYDHINNSENFEEYLKAIGVNYVYRKLSKIMPTSIVLNKHNKEYEITTLTPINQNMVMKFTPGEQTEYVTHAGHKVISHPTVEENVIKERMMINGRNILKSTIFDGNDLKVELKVGDIQASMYYKLDPNATENP